MATARDDSAQERRSMNYRNRIHNNHHHHHHHNKNLKGTNDDTMRTLVSKALLLHKWYGSGSTNMPRCIGWSIRDAMDVGRYHPILCVAAFSLFFFMGVEYTLNMVPSASPPFDLGFFLTHPIHRLLAPRPVLNAFLAALNTVFVGMQTAYIVWVWLVEGRPRATISALFMFTCRGILGYSTRLPLPQGFLGSRLDFPVGNVSFFLFFSGHVAGTVIASLDMWRMQRREMARMCDSLNVLQAIRLLVTRGHYTIDLAAGVGAGFLFDSLAGKYEKCKRRSQYIAPPPPPPPSPPPPPLPVISPSTKIDK